MSAHSTTSSPRISVPPDRSHCCGIPCSHSDRHGLLRCALRSARSNNTLGKNSLRRGKVMAVQANKSNAAIHTTYNASTSCKPRPDRTHTCPSLFIRFSQRITSASCTSAPSRLDLELRELAHTHRWQTSHPVIESTS